MTVQKATMNSFFDIGYRLLILAYCCIRSTFSNPCTGTKALKVELYAYFVKSVGDGMYLPGFLNGVQ